MRREERTTLGDVMLASMLGIMLTAWMWLLVHSQ